ncbi:MAG: bifunctional phosphopantothenoylcysteine decarboxylase/phosphopantothenate--cysteine ligase CoaBC [Christensenellales bacterium]
MPLCVVVGLSGGIAAYKCAYLVSALVRKGCDVHVLMTKNAHQFIGEVTFETLSGNAVLTDTFDRKGEYSVNHVSLAKKADVLIVAPATADLIAKAAHGIADDMLTTTLLAVRCPVIFAPAMNEAMLKDEATRHNLSLLKNRGYNVMDTGFGALACKDTGEGRMKEPDEIISFMDDVLAARRDMHNIRMLISAGPTREMIDPVRFLSNRSSGKMGYAIAQAAVKRGADVTLVSGPVALNPPDGARVINVISASSMYEQMLGLSAEADIIVMTAAVSDYRPKEYSELKIKKGENTVLELVRTDDILTTLGRRKKDGQLLVGFAAETNDCDANAQSKLREKNLDIVALNDVSRQGEGFESDYNNIKLFFRGGRKTDLGSAEKQELSRGIVDILYKQYTAGKAL